MDRSPASERLKIFDSLVEKNAEVLAHPKVISTLGTVTVEHLRSLNDSFYLPNFRNGIIEVPSSKIEGDTIALFPILRSDKKALQGDSFAKLSYSARASLIESLNTYKAFLSIEEGEEIASNLQAAAINGWDMKENDIIQRMNLANLSQLDLDTDLEVAAATVSDIFEPLPGTEIAYRQKELIVTGSALRRDASAGFVGASVAHELIHVKNSRAMQDNMTEEELASDELEAYHASFVIDEAYWHEMSLAERESNEVVRIIERFRSRYTDNLYPYIASRSLVKLMAKYQIVENA